MKRIYLSIVAILVAVTVFGQSPNSFKYQAVVRNASGVVIANTVVGMQLSILQGSIGGTSVCTEAFTPTTNTFGLVNLEVGSVDSLAFAAIDWSAGPYFLKVEFDSTGGTTYALMGTSQLLSVPYALYAETAGTITETDPLFAASVANGITGVDTTNWNNKDYANLTNKPAIVDTVMAVIDTTTQFVRTEIQGLNDVLTNGTSAGNQNITNLADPVNDQDAATKAYVNNMLIQVGDIAKLLSVNFTVQQLLDGGRTVKEFVDASIPFDSLYGKTYQGGLIFYVDGSGAGLVAASIDQSQAGWGCSGTDLTGASGTLIGTGAQNTIDIEAGCTTVGTAADVCANLSLSTYNDWFLPSIDELSEMYDNLHVLGFGNFVGTYYWSSSESSTIYSQAVNFSDGTVANLSSKGNNSYVRAIRAF